MRPCAIVFAVASAISISTESSGQTPIAPKPDDFAMQIPVQATGQNGVVRFTLPLSVYEHARHNGLADVRLFDAAGLPVPFAFTDLEPKVTVEQRESAVKIFPVRADPRQAHDELELDVRAARDGTVLSVTAKYAGSDSDSSLQALVLDLGAQSIDQQLESLRFVLPAGIDTYRAELAVERSEDLKWWTRVAQSRVDWLRDASQTTSIANDRIDLSEHGGRYARIRWIEGRPLLFGAVTARWRNTRTADNEPVQVELVAKAGRFPGDWAYAASPALNASEIGLNLPTANTVFPASIGYYRQDPSPKRDWRFIPVTSNTFFRLTQNGVERTSSRIRIAPLGLEEWVIRPQGSNQAPFDRPPTLVLRFKPRALVFTAQGGRQQFLLAFGASNDRLRRWTTSATGLEWVAPGFSSEELQQVETALLGEPQPSQRDLSQAAPTPRTESDERRRWILWAALIAGTLLLAGMTWRLARQMRSKE